MSNPMLHWAGGDTQIIGGGAETRYALAANCAFMESASTKSQILYPTGGTITRFGCVVRDSTVTGPSTIVVQIDGVAGNSIITIPALTPDHFIEGVGSDTFPDGSLIDSFIHTGGTSSDLLRLTGAGFLFQSNIGETVTRFAVFHAGSVGPDVDKTGYLPIWGAVDPVQQGNNPGTIALAELRTRCYMAGSGTLRLPSSLARNTRDADATAILKKNGIATGYVFTFPAGMPDFDRDTLIDTGVDYVTGDYFNWELPPSGTTGQLLFGHISMETVTNGCGPLGAARGSGQTAGTDDRYFNPIGDCTSNVDEIFLPKALQRTRFSAIGVTAVNNQCPVDTVFNFYYRLGDSGPFTLGNQTFEVPALTDGHFFSDPSLVDILEAEMEFYLKCEGNGSGFTMAVCVVDFLSCLFSPPNERSGIYKIVPDSHKTNDTLWDENFDGTTDVKIPNPKYRIGPIP